MTEQFDPLANGSEEVELADLLEAMAQMLRVGLQVHVPARVVTYDPATQLAAVQVENRTVVRVSSPDKMPAGAEPIGAGNKALLPPKIVQGIPVVFPGTSTAYFTVPIVPGTTGTLHVHSRALDQWMLKGAPCDPLFTWTHVLESSEFHPGLHPKTGPITPPTDLTATVVEGPLVKIGRLAVEPTVKATTLFSLLDSALAAASTAGAPVPGDGGKVAFDAFIAAWNLGKAACLTTKAQVE